MNEFVLHRCDVRVLLSHMALYGLGAILQESGVENVRLGWTIGMQPRPWINGTGLTRQVLDTAVGDHARAHTDPESWTQRDIELNGAHRGLMSPRLTSCGTKEVWHQLQASREQVLDTLTEQHAWADLSYLAALGEPSYWRYNRQGQSLQDDAASRLEMQPRNHGSEFVRSRLRKLAKSVAERAPGTVVAGIAGDQITDEIGSDAVDSSTPTGLSVPGATDNALAWCALWGIGQLPTAPRVGTAAVTSGHLGRPRSEWFYAPVWTQPWRPARLRTMLAAMQLRNAATADLPAATLTADPAQLLAARKWLTTRSVIGVMRFPVERFGSNSAPERRAMRGTKLSLQ